MNFHTRTTNGAWLRAECHPEIGFEKQLDSKQSNRRNFNKKKIPTVLSHEEKTNTKVSSNFFFRSKLKILQSSNPKPLSMFQFYFRKSNQSFDQQKEKPNPFLKLFPTSKIANQISNSKKKNLTKRRNSRRDQWENLSQISSSLLNFFLPKSPTPSLKMEGVYIREY